MYRQSFWFLRKGRRARFSGAIRVRSCRRAVIGDHLGAKHPVRSGMFRLRIGSFLTPAALHQDMQGRSDRGHRGNPFALSYANNARLAEPIYRELVSTLFTMTVPVLGFGILYILVGSLIFVQWQDWLVGVLVGCAIIVTTARVLLIAAYTRAGGASQDLAALRDWERRYVLLTCVFSLLLAALNVRGLSMNEPVVHLSTISLTFIFGAGLVSRNAGRPRVCVAGISLAVIPTVAALIVHAASTRSLTAPVEFYVLEAILLTATSVMSLASARHLYASLVEQLTTKHDLAKLARYDPLTGLPNRLLLRESFQQALASLRQSSDRLAVHYLDLDGFKGINDQYGHPMGDRLLIEVARRLASIVRPSDVVARIGGDEFIIIQLDVQHQGQAELLARRIIRQLSEPYLIESSEMHVSVSVGVAIAPDCGFEIERLIACADAALYSSKTRGKAQVRFYAPDAFEEASLAVA
jgi:diguanylate cyclase (GGDEF)-like protein